MQDSGGGIRYSGGVKGDATKGVLCIQMCHFMDNTAGSSSGGVSTGGDSTAVTISDSTFSGNCAKVHSACCPTSPFVLSFCMGIVIEGHHFEKMLCYTGDKDPMKACAQFSCCMLFDGP